MSDDSDSYQYSSDEGGVNDEKHRKLVDNVLGLSKVQNVRKPSRTEPTLEVSEFNLVKSVTGNKGFVQLNELANTLKSRKKHAQISEKLKTSSKKAKTLPKPLEEPQAQRITRTVNYEKTRLGFDRWEAFVTSKRASLHQVFPIETVEKIKVEQKQAETYTNTWRLKSELQKELEKLQPQVETYVVGNQEDKYPLTLTELKEKRQESVKLRAHQRFKEAKARKQNKIKSKKYHRILKREKVKHQLKEFEELQKINPEEALKKLEEIEKARAEERFSLRHKGTGQWARNKQIRAKYDKESRQVLAQQLSISRDLTQKVKVIESDSEDENAHLEEDKITNDESSLNNPWMNVKPDKEVHDFMKGYKKYWNERNENVNGTVDESYQKKNLKTYENVCSIQNVETEGDKAGNPRDVMEKVFAEQIFRKQKTKLQNKILKNKKVNNVSKGRQATTSGFWDTVINYSDSAEKSKRKRTKNLAELDVMFENAENKIGKKLGKKLVTLNKSGTTKRTQKRPSKPSAENKTADLSFKTLVKKQVIDEELRETVQDRYDDSNENLTDLKNLLLLQTSDESQGGNNNTTNTNNIDPNKFLQKSYTIDLSTGVPDLLTKGENDDDDKGQRELIIEAFEDDDLVQDFDKEKSKIIEEDIPKDIDLNLPGWGNWAGSNIKTRRKRRRFIIKMPQSIPRRDDNKGSLIINEKAQTKIKGHMVSEVPFPFKTIKDYEASIRSPIGNTFVTENAFKRLVRPSVKTTIGSIIEPVTKDFLVGRKKL